jgi:hypothetical protein
MTGPRLHAKRGAGRDELQLIRAIDWSDVIANGSPTDERELIPTGLAERKTICGKSLEKQ